MSRSNNPHQPGDRVQIKRGGKWLTGVVEKTILNRTFIHIDGRVFVEPKYRDVRRAPCLTSDT